MLRMLVVKTILLTSVPLVIWFALPSTGNSPCGPWCHTGHFSNTGHFSRLDACVFHKNLVDFFCSLHVKSQTRCWLPIENQYLCSNLVQVIMVCRLESGRPNCPQLNMITYYVVTHCVGHYVWHCVWHYVYNTLKTLKAVISWNEYDLTANDMSDALSMFALSL